MSIVIVVQTNLKLFGVAVKIIVLVVYVLVEWNLLNL